tara:strand:- start:7585 stop:11853 length:4269 start_codon:yes stop_codon:yes gene_type:complete
MDKRPPNPRRLSRKLFSSKPEIKPQDITGLNVPEFALGKEKSIRALRSDIKDIRVREGEDFLTYDLFRIGVRKGNIPQFKRTDTPSKEEYEEWREENIGEQSKRIRSKRDPYYLTHGQNRRRLTEEEIDKIKEKEEDGNIDVLVGAPLARYETKGMTKEQKEEYFANQRKEIKQISGMLPFSLTDEIRKKKANELAESREGMSRSQQRKLGRVIRDGKTGPQTRTRKDPYEEDETRNVYEVVEYEPKKFDFADREATLEYTYGYNKGKGDLLGERDKIIESFSNERDRLEQLDKEYKLLRDEKKKILSKYKDELKGASKQQKDRAYLSMMGVSSKDVFFSGGGAAAGGAFTNRLKKNIIPPIGKRGSEFSDSLRNTEISLSKGLTELPLAFRPFLTPEERKELQRTQNNIGKIRDEVGGIVKRSDGLKSQIDEIRLSQIPEQVVKTKRVVVRNKKELNEAIAEMKKEEGIAVPLSKNFMRHGADITLMKSELPKHLQDRRDRRDRARYKEGGEFEDVRNTPDTFFTLHSNQEWDKADARSVKDARYIVKHKRRHMFYGLDDDIITKEVNPDRGRKRVSGKGYQLEDYWQGGFKRFDLTENPKYANKTTGKNPLLDKSDEEANTFLRGSGMLTGSKFEDRKLPETNFSHNGVKMSKQYLSRWDRNDDIKPVPMDSEGGVLLLKEVEGRGSRTEEVMNKGMKYNDTALNRLFVGKDGKVKMRKFKGKQKRPIKKVRVIRDPNRDVLGNRDFVMRVGRGKGRRVFHLEEGKEKGWKQTAVNKYTKQSEQWKSLDVDTTPAKELQLRGIRDRRTGGGRLIGRGRLDPRRVDRSKEYKSARNEALIQMRINESAGVRDAKSSAEKEIKNIRISEAQKALNLRLQKETAEKTTEGLKQKNAGLTHSYNVNVRNQTAATLLGSDPIELNKVLKQGGGLALIKTMIRKGEIVDASTIGQLNTSAKQKENLLRLLNEGGDFVEGQEYFFRDLDDFGRTAVRRGYLNKGGERKKNLELMKITTNDDGTTSTERFIVPKAQIVKPDDYTTTTSSGRKQAKVPRAITDFELDLFSETAPEPKDVKEVSFDPKTGAKSLVKSKGAGIADPSPRVGGSILSSLRTDGDFDTMGGDINLNLSIASDESGASATSEEGFEFGGDAPVEPEPQSLFEGVPPSPYGPSPSAQRLTASIDEELDLAMGGGEADEIAEVLGGDVPETYRETIDTAAADFEETEKGWEDMERLLKEQKAKSGEREEALEKALEEVEPKKVSISDEVKELFIKDVKTPSSVPKEWSAAEDDVPSPLLRDSWDFRGRGLKSRLAEDGTQNVPEGYIAIWTTKWAPKDNQTALIVNEADAYYLMRGLRNVGVKNDKGKSNPITDAKLKSFYRKVIEGIRDGNKQTAFNDKQLLRALDMIEPYKEEEEEEDEDAFTL